MKKQVCAEYELHDCSDVMPNVGPKNTGEFLEVRQCTGPDELARQPTEIWERRNNQVNSEDGVEERRQVGYLARSFGLFGL
jgi:hypothetical protein